MKHILLVDFGSTYTKVSAVDIEKEKIVGTAMSYTTVETDINNGLENALTILKEKTGISEFHERYACSSAAGGLRMCASGFVPELTTKAAKLASLGAGAKVIKTYEYELTKADIREIDDLKPDIFLLSGGTNGGNSKVIIHNAKMLATCQSDFPILISGNRSAADECEELLANKRTFVTENVMPRLNELNMEPVKEKIREVFLENIISAKGLTKATELMHDIMIPTPSAMLEAMKLLSVGTKTQAGIGELLAVDLGGATTDIYSMAEGIPEQENAIIKGFIEPYAKRTVEGDIGMRYSASSLLENATVERIAALSGNSEEYVIEAIENFKLDYGVLPETTEHVALDYALAASAIDISVSRHVGKLEEVYTMMGNSFVQTGKDLRSVKKVIFTGGALVHANNPKELLPFALQSKDDPYSLKPKKAELFIDKKYVLSAMGLLGKHYPDTALKIMKEEIQSYGY